MQVPHQAPAKTLQHLCAILCRQQDEGGSQALNRSCLSAMVL